MKLHVEVEQVYISAGVRCDVDRCPVALAFLGQHAIRAEVGPNSGRLRMATGWKHVQWPDEVAMRINAFDSRRGMEPFAFDVEVPE